jgi:hypothetical protein
MSGDGFNKFSASKSFLINILEARGNVITLGCSFFVGPSK